MNFRSPQAMMICFVVALFACAPDQDLIFVPDHFPALSFSDDNVVTQERIDFGSRLFHDPVLSADSSISCTHCHLPRFAFADTTAFSDGIGGALGQRNAPSLFNVAYLQEVNKDGGVKHLDLQALVPIEDEHEMALPVLQLQKRLEQDAEYVRLAKLAYDRPPDAFAITRGLATFVRTLISAESAYDDFIRGDTLALSSTELRGMSLFQSDRLGCQDCHKGPLFTDNGFASNGLYTEYKDLGRALITMNAEDRGKFRIPSLRNVAITAPYMHDGSLQTIEEVLSHYEFDAHTDSKNPDPRIRTFTLSFEERQALIQFLTCLTDRRFLK